MSSATFRHPGPLAISVAQVDQMSGGRVELGLGAGWYAEEHDAYAIPFPPVGERFDRLTEQLAILSGLWSTPDGEIFSFSGDHYSVVDSPALPKPHQRPGPPIVVGGHGVRRTPALAAQYAAEFNVGFSDEATTGAQFERVRAACREIGRDPGDLVYSAAQVLCCGETDAVLGARAERIGRSPDELRRDGLAGSPQEVVDKIGRYAELGAERIYLQVLDLHDLDHIRLVADQMMPHV
ncbi:MAG: LLM class flavin-dependent oxidoreductase [Nocardioides sp.]